MKELSPCASRASASTQRFSRPVPFSGLRPVRLRISRNVGKANRSWVGPLSSFQITPFKRCLESPRLPRPCRTRSLKNARRDFLAGQFFVGDPPSGSAGERTHKASAVRSLAVVIAKRLFIQISEKMERLYADVGSFQAAFQQAPEVLQTIRVNPPIDVSLRVINEAVKIFRIQTLIRYPRIGEDFPILPLRSRGFPSGVCDAGDL
jgi:hypothetical protein